MIELIGMTAGFLTTVCTVPQLVKVIKTKHTKDLSLWYFLILDAGVILWFVYGMYMELWPVILANVFTGIMVSAIVGYKLKYK